MNESETLSSLLNQIREIIGDEEKKRQIEPLLAQLSGLGDRQAFKLERTLKDKSIAINLLNRTIEDLQEQQSYIEETNKQLSYQKKLLETQSMALQDNVRELELSNQELEQFSHIVSHDLRSPLRTITSYAQLLKRRYYHQLSEEADEFLDFITSGAIRMDQVLQDLLKFTQTGNRDLKKTRVDIGEIIEIVRFALQEEIRESQAVIRFGPMPEIYANSSEMIQLFQNLISNAVKFRGNVPPEIVINSTAQNGYHYFSVEDNGIGLDEIYQTKAFMPFQRLSNFDFPGTGMGLAICKKIVSLHNGKIWYETRPGGGTIFHFSIQQLITPVHIPKYAVTGV